MKVEVQHPFMDKIRFQIPVPECLVNTWANVGGRKAGLITLVDGCVRHHLMHVDDGDLAGFGGYGLDDQEHIVYKTFMLNELLPYYLAEIDRRANMYKEANVRLMNDKA